MALLRPVTLYALSNGEWRYFVRTDGSGNIEEHIGPFDVLSHVTSVKSRNIVVALRSAEKVPTKWNRWADHKKMLEEGLLNCSFKIDGYIDNKTQMVMTADGVKADDEGYELGQETIRASFGPRERVMTTDKATFEDYIDRMFNECRRQLVLKGPEYTVGSKDRLHNFRSIPQWNTKLDAIDVAGVYWDKHVMAIKNYIATRRSGSEPINGRIVDCINYLLFLGMLFEEQGEPTKELPDMVASS